MFTADKIKLFIAVLVFAAGIAGYYFLGDKSQLIRVLTLLVAGGVAMAVFLQTPAGRASWAFIKEARIELRKVVWPARKETVQVTLAVIVMIIAVALFLWLIDWGLSFAMRALTGPGA